MARITEEQKELINELYAEIGVKSQVAKIVGCSPASVTKYLIPNYVPKAQRIQITFDKKANDCGGFIMKINDLIAQGYGVPKALLKTCSIDATEKAELEVLRKEIF